jgi:hypothetical protein
MPSSAILDGQDDPFPAFLNPVWEGADGPSQLSSQIELIRSFILPPFRGYERSDTLGIFIGLFLGLSVPQQAHRFHSVPIKGTDPLRTGSQIDRETKLLRNSGCSAVW